MRNSALASIVVLSSLPCGALPFTARPIVGRSTITSPATSRHPTKVHGLLPDFLTRNKEQDEVASDVPNASPGEAVSSDMTEMALEKTDDAEVEIVCEPKEKTAMEKVKEAGVAGAISYALWELGFWGISIPVCAVGYQRATGHWPDFSNSDDMAKLGAEAFAFVNFARLAVPLRIGLALATAPWIDENVVKKFINKPDDEECVVPEDI